MTGRSTPATRLLLSLPTVVLAGAAVLAGVGSAGRASRSEARLYRTPGGLYTQADIRANGILTPAERFRAYPVHHDLHPAPGDPICPITRTRANPRIAWIVGGRRYLFCCPPCIDEFVARAKRDPRAIRPPAEYVQR